MVAAAFKADGGLCAATLTSKMFALNVLAQDQLDIAKAFFRSTSVEDDQINGQSFTPGSETGAAILDEVPFYFEYRVTDVVEGGDHTVFVAEVTNAGVRDADSHPLNLRSTGMNYGG